MLRILTGLVAGLFAIGALAVWWVFAHGSVLFRSLEISDAPERADVIVVPSGDDEARLSKAAELCAEGYARKILVTGFKKIDPGVESIQKTFNIPSTALIIEPKAINTYTNATRSAPLLRKNGARTAILVTSWYHSRRAPHTFRHVMPDVCLISVPTHRASWPVSREVLNLEFRELCYYGIAYQVSPL